MKLKEITQSARDFFQNTKDGMSMVLPKVPKLVLRTTMKTFGCKTTAADLLRFYDEYKLAKETFEDAYFSHRGGTCKIGSPEYKKLDYNKHVAFNIFASEVEYYIQEHKGKFNRDTLQAEFEQIGVDTEKARDIIRFASVYLGVNSVFAQGDIAVVALAQAISGLPLLDQMEDSVDVEINPI